MLIVLQLKHFLNENKKTAFTTVLKNTLNKLNKINARLIFWKQPITFERSYRRPTYIKTFHVLELETQY